MLLKIHTFKKNVKMLLFLFIRDFSYNEKFDGVFNNIYNEKYISVVSSGSSSSYFTTIRLDVSTKAESVINPRDKLEWCSNIDRTKKDRPWIVTIFRDRKLTMSGYSIKSGCCEIAKSGCCCMLYSWSILGSNDNKTWTKLHSVEKDQDLKKCTEMSFRVDKKGFYSMFKIMQDEPHPECYLCFSINQIEFYGTIDKDIDEETSNVNEVSIVGKYKRGES